MDIYEINLRGNLNAIQMDLINVLFPKGSEQILLNIKVFLHGNQCM